MLCDKKNTNVLVTNKNHVIEKTFLKINNYGLIIMIKLIVKES